MKLPHSPYALALILLFLFPAVVFAEKLYVSETLIVSMRDRASLQGEVVSYLKSGDLLEVISRDEDGFVLVQTTSGERGWVPEKYTITEKPKALLIAELEKEIKSLKARLEALASTTTVVKDSAQAYKIQIHDKEQEIAQLQKTIMALKETAANAGQKYEDLREKSQDVEKIFAERDNLVARLKTADQEVDQLRSENAGLVQRDRQLWFLVGFGVFLVGWIMGKVFKRSRRGGLSL
ncbi:MAG: TIGR04211 family SH3 domain-containing protein [Deltaproteobacteria bacterium]|jgi:SH3 domain protein|nr:TIGR04211 family SH3 domain-containing protein [Deltaproteobacteria bacterium]